MAKLTTDEIIEALKEMTLLEASELVLNVTWEEHVRKYHPNCLDKLVHIEHPLLVRPKENTCPPSREERSRSRVIFAGSLSAGVRDPEFALNLFCRLGDVAHLDMYVMGSGRDLVQPTSLENPDEIGRASCRERV